MDNQYDVRTKGNFLNKSLDQKIINSVTPISIQTWHWRLCHFVYQKILRLLKVADRIDVKIPIPGEIFGDYIKRRQQRKPSYELNLQPSEYLDYIQCDLAGSYPTTRKGNPFYFGVRDSATGAYYAEPMRTKSQTFDIFQKFIRQR